MDSINTLPHTHSCNFENVEEVEVQRNSFILIMELWLHPWNSFIFKTIEVNSWEDTWSYSTDLLADSQHIQPQLLQTVTWPFQLPINPWWKASGPTWQSLGANRAPFNRCHSVDEWDKTEGTARKKVQADHCFPSVCYHGRAPDAWDS